MNIKELVNKAKEIEDQSEVQAGGDFEYTPPAAGRTVGRFIEYIELGKHVEMYEGKPKPPAEMVRVTFEFTLPDRVKEVEIDGVKKKIAERISYNMPKKFTEKAKYYKLFKAMTYGRDSITHMAEMLGEAFVFDIKHNTKGEGDKKKTFANLYQDSTWGVFAPRSVDPLTNVSTDLSSKVPEALSPLRIFIWDIPTKETWDSLFIDGEREVKDGDTTKKVSKNWLQERLLSATDFGGSALEQMLNDIPDLPTSGTGTQASNEKQENAPAENPSENATVNPDEDPMKALGF